MKNPNLSRIITLMITVGLMFTVTACSDNSTKKKSSSKSTSLSFSSSSFSNPGNITNEYFPLTPGELRSWIKQEEQGGESEVIAVIEQRVLEPDPDSTVAILGIEGYIIVEETEFEEGEVTETNRDYYAQDDDGNVWQLGSTAHSYDDGYEAEGGDDEDSWIAGVDGARPGLVMPSEIRIGDSFSVPGEPDEKLTIVALDQEISVPYDGETNRFDPDIETTFSNVVTIALSEGTTVEDTLYYAEGYGLVSGKESEDGEGAQETFALFSYATANYDSEFNAQNFTNPKPTMVEDLNPWLPLLPGNQWVYLKNVEDGIERITTTVSNTKTRTILGVECIVVDDTVEVNGGLEEVTEDYYAMDDDGNIWYMGEESSHFDPDTGEFVRDGGSWIAGETTDEYGELAQPGILIAASPQPGMLYRQEFLAEIAEDNATVVGEDLEIEWDETVDGTQYEGTYEDVLKTHEYAGHELSVTEPIITEFKYYVEGIGKIAEEDPNDEEFGFLVNFVDASAL